MNPMNIKVSVKEVNRCLVGVLVYWPTIRETTVQTPETDYNEKIGHLSLCYITVEMLI